MRLKQLVGIEYMTAKGLYVYRVDHHQQDHDMFSVFSIVCDLRPSTTVLIMYTPCVWVLCAVSTCTFPDGATSYIFFFIHSINSPAGINRGNFLLSGFRSMHAILAALLYYPTFSISPFTHQYFYMQNTNIMRGRIF